MIHPGGESGCICKETGKGAPVTPELAPWLAQSTDERALALAPFRRSLARGDRLHLVASAAHGRPATVDGAPLSASSPDEITMQQGPTVKAQPSALSDGSFSVTWEHA